MRPGSVTLGICLNALGLFLLFGRGMVGLVFLSATVLLHGGAEIKPEMFILVAFAAEIAFPVFFLVKIAARRNWARFAYPVFAIAILGFIASLFHRGAGSAHHFIVPLDTGLLAVSFVLFFLPSSNRWFQNA